MIAIIMLTIKMVLKIMIYDQYHHLGSHYKTQKNTYLDHDEVDDADNGDDTDVHDDHDNGHCNHLEYVSSHFEAHKNTSNNAWINIVDDHEADLEFVATIATGGRVKFLSAV